MSSPIIRFLIPSTQDMPPITVETDLAFFQTRGEDVFSVTETPRQSGVLESPEIFEMMLKL